MPLTARIFAIAAASSGAIAVIFGAFGAHALKAKLTPDMLKVYETGSQYHFYHIFGLFAISLLAFHFPSSTLLKWSGSAMIIGTILFSGSLYLLAITGTKKLGAITPIGGIFLIASWILLAVAAWRATTTN